MTATPRIWRMSANANTGDTWVAPDTDPRAYVEEEAVKNMAAGDVVEAPFGFTVFNRGKQRGDLLHAGGAFIVVASDRLIRVLEDIEATGWVSAPVPIRYANGETLPGYQLLVPVGRCTNFHADLDPDDEDDVVRGGPDGRVGRVRRVLVRGPGDDTPGHRPGQAGHRGRRPGAGAVRGPHRRRALRCVTTPAGFSMPRGRFVRAVGGQRRRPGNSVRPRDEVPVRLPDGGSGGLGSRHLYASCVDRDTRGVLFPAALPTFRRVPAPAPVAA
ncbi:MAG: hypothetical protein L0H93_19690 [Nocardioides sp.]|nr:hypothetical protein [Nocardioides sp.]